MEHEIKSPTMGKQLTILEDAVLLFVLTLYLFVPPLHSVVQNRILQFLRAHFASDIQFSDFDVSLYPSVHVTIHELVLRYKGRTDLPPLVDVREVSIEASLRSLTQSRPRIKSVRLVGLKIRMPPRPRGDEPLVRPTDEDLQREYPALVEEIRADDAVIIIMRALPKKSSREFLIHHLLLRNVSFDRPATFHAVLANSVPPGEIDSSGEFGPWHAAAPSTTPVSGQYTFRDADLGTLKGIQGTLSSEGRFNGQLDYLRVNGKTDTPNFTLRTAAHPMALHTEFSAMVDGTNGNTYLESIRATFSHSSLAVSGKVVDIDPEKKGRTIVLLAAAQNARVEDLVQLGVKTDEPVMTGIVKLKTEIEIPEGDGDLVERLKVNGSFEITDGQFTSPKVQTRVDALSRKAQGQPTRSGINDVASHMAGTFSVAHDVVNLSSLHFCVAGAAMHVHGTYDLDAEALDFRGTLAMQAKLSQTTSGAKSFLLKAFDPLFKDKDAGSRLPIKISGTKEHPVFGLDHPLTSKL